MVKDRSAALRQAGSLTRACTNSANPLDLRKAVRSHMVPCVRACVCACVHTRIDELYMEY